MLASRMADAANQLMPRLADMFSEVTYNMMTPTQAFNSVFGGPITINKTDQGCTIAQDCLAWVNIGVNTVNTTIQLNPHLLIHEVFHIFDLNILGGSPNTAVSRAQSNDNLPDRPNLAGPSRETWGLGGPNFSDWQKSRSGLASEELADMGIGWFYQFWGGGVAGSQRDSFMNSYMPLWVSAATINNEN
ncbi:MAG: hypothetical protein AAF902_10080 [Chloroflexota bacterium]